MSSLSLTLLLEDLQTILTIATRPFILIGYALLLISFLILLRIQAKPRSIDEKINKKQQKARKNKEEAEKNATQTPPATPSDTDAEEEEQASS